MLFSIFEQIKKAQSKNCKPFRFPSKKNQHRKNGDWAFFIYSNSILSQQPSSLSFFLSLSLRSPIFVIPIEASYSLIYKNGELFLFDFSFLKTLSHFFTSLDLTQIRFNSMLFSNQFS